MTQTALDILTDPHRSRPDKVLAAARLLHDRHCLSAEIFDEIYRPRDHAACLRSAAKILLGYFEDHAPASARFRESPESPAPRYIDIDETQTRPPPKKPGRPKKKKSPPVHRTRAEYSRLLSSRAVQFIRDHDPDAAGFKLLAGNGRSPHKYVVRQSLHSYSCQVHCGGFHHTQSGFTDPLTAQKHALRTARAHFGFDTQPRGGASRPIPTEAAR